MTLVNVGNDSWLLEYQACENLSREIMEQLHARNKERPGTMPYDSISGKVRLRLKQHENEIAQLRKKLQLPNEVSQLTDDEKNRRLQQVGKLQGRLMQLQELFEQKILPGGTSRNVIVDMGTTGWGEDENEQVRVAIDAQRNLPIQDIRATQDEMLRAQDEGLAELAQVISRQKRITTVINNELTDQNEILDDIGNNMDRVDTRVQNETLLIRTISRKDKTCYYWVIIILLTIAIIVVGIS